MHCKIKVVTVKPLKLHYGGSKKSMPFGGGANCKVTSVGECLVYPPVSILFGTVCQLVYPGYTIWRQNFDAERLTLVLIYVVFGALLMYYATIYEV